MTTTLKWTTRIALSILAVIAIIALLSAISRALYPTAEQRESLAVMQLPKTPEGENGFAALWTLERAVPRSEMTRVVETDAARIAELPRFPDPDDGEMAKFITAAAQYPDLAPSLEDQGLFCNHEREDCLTKVTSDISVYRALIERNRELLNRVDALATYDYVRQALPWRMSGPTLASGRARLSSTRHALWFADGRVDDALAASCRAIDTWRRLGASSDLLILRLIANAFATRNHGKLLAEMLAELPVDYPLPSECEQALVPPTTQELSLCTAMRGEFEWIKETTGPMLQQAKKHSWWEWLKLTLFYDAEATQIDQAKSLVLICTDAELQRIAADRAEMDRPEPPGVWRFACLGNLAGCVLSSIVTPDYASYRTRMQDFGARIKLLGTLIWLRENADRPEPLIELLAGRPNTLKSPSRQIEINQDGASLHIQMFADQSGDIWSVPLPAELRR